VNVLRVKMLANGQWGCRRFWSQGPPGARGLYFYRTLYDFTPRFRPLVRLVPDGMLVGTERNHFFLQVRYR
jgi:hypothetical protein